MRRYAKAIWMAAALLALLAAFAPGILAAAEQTAQDHEAQAIEKAAQAALEQSGEPAQGEKVQGREAAPAQDAGQEAVPSQDPGPEAAPEGEAGQEAPALHGRRVGVQNDGMGDAALSPQKEEDAQSGQSREQAGDAGRGGREMPSVKTEAEKQWDALPALQRIQVSINDDVLQPGARARVRATGFPRAQGRKVQVSWSTSAPQWVTVTESGLVRVDAGADLPEGGAYVDIWACTTDGSLIMDCVTVRVMPAMQSLRVAQDQVRLSLAGDAFEGVAVEMQPESLIGLAQVRWESSDESVVRVSASGAGEAAMLYAVGPGQATVTARAMDSSGCQAVLSVTVE